MKRRHLLLAGAMAGGGLLVGCTPPSPSSRLAGSFGLNAWVRITPDGAVVVATPRSEMGQGVHTALAMLVAEELDADWSRVGTEQPPPDGLYANQALLLNVLPFGSDDEGPVARLSRAAVQRAGLLLKLQVTGGSSSVRDAWEPMRLAGASARAMLLQAAADAWQVPASECSTEPGVVKHAASGRRAGYGELAARAQRLAVPDDVGLKFPADWRLIGKPVPRLDVPAKSRGQAVYGIDVRPPGLLHAAIRHCPVFGGRIRSFDATTALAMRGVKDVFQLGDDRLCVVADNSWRAREALRTVKVQDEDGPHAALDSAAITRQLRAAAEGEGGFAFRRRGDAAATLAAAAQRIEATYEVPFLAHAAMEPVNCTAQVKDGAVTIWCGTQVPQFARWRAARVAQVEMDRVTVHVPYLGGGFGRRLEFDMVEDGVAAALRTGGRPVQLLWSREEDFQHDFYRPAAAARFAAALDGQGRPLAWLNRVAAPSVALGTMERIAPKLAMDMPDKTQVEGAFDLPYAVPHLAVHQVRVKTPVPVGSWRSVGHSYNAFFTESFIDELAHAAHQDPFEYRRALLAARPRQRAVLERAAAEAGWGTPAPEGRARGIALHESFGSIVAQVVEASVDGGRPRVHRVVCAIDCGIVVNPDTVRAQMEGAIVFALTAALHGRITLQRGRVQQSNFHDQPLATLAQVPVVETHLIASPEAPGGVGEPGTPPLAPALANALFVLTGRRLRKLPLQMNGDTPT